MTWGIAFSAVGAQSLVEAGLRDQVVARGAPAVAAARAAGLETLSLDALFDSVVAEEIDRAALTAARSWRPGPLSPSLGDLDLGLVAEYDLFYVAARVLRLAAALAALPDGAEVLLACSPEAPEAAVVDALAQARRWRLRITDARPHPRTPLDIAARAPRPGGAGRRLAKYWLARLATLGPGRGMPVGVYMYGESAPLVLPLVGGGLVRPVLDPTEPPPRALYGTGALRGAGWAGLGRAPRRGRRSALPAPPSLQWQGIDLGMALAQGLEIVIGNQVRIWKWYAESLSQAWRRSGVRAVVVTDDCTSRGRVRVLIAERLGIPSIVVQHGVLMWIGDRNHEVGDYSAVWGDLAAKDFAARGIAAERLAVVGWPAASARVAALPGMQRGGAGDFALILTTDLALATALVPEDAVERVAETAVRAIRAGGWSGKIVAKIHPSQSSAWYREVFRRAGHPEVEVAEGRSDPWPLMAAARVVVAASSSVACGLPHLGKTAVLYDLIRPPYAPYLARFGQFWDAATPEAAGQGVAQLLTQSGAAGNQRQGDSALDYAAALPDAAERFAELLTRAVKSGCCSQGGGALGRALDAEVAHPKPFDKLPSRVAAGPSLPGLALR